MTELSNGFVCIMGMGIVFIGLICIVFICMFISFCVTRMEKGENSSDSGAGTAAAAAETELPAEEKRKVVAGVCAAIAEELGPDVTNIRVLSFKRV